MAKRERKKASKIERTFKILEYLKKNTDSEHPVRQSEMRKDPAISEYLGDKETFNHLIKDMAEASGLHRRTKEAWNAIKNGNQHNPDKITCINMHKKQGKNAV